MRIAVLKLERTEEEKLRRHLHGDKGARYKKGKQFTFDVGGISPTVTTLVTKDISLIEYENLDNPDER